MADVRTRIRWDRRKVRELGMEPGVQDAIEVLGAQMRDRMRMLAPKKTGAGAGSIEVRDDKRYADSIDVGWDAAHYYLIFPEFGTEKQEAQRFARRALYETDYRP